MLIALSVVALIFIFVLLPARLAAAQRALIFRYLMRYGLSAALGVAGVLLAARGREVMALVAIAGAIAAWPWPGPPKPQAGAPNPADEQARAILGVGPDASASEIRAAFRRKMAEAHPDRGGSQDAAARLVSARDRLLRRR